MGSASLSRSMAYWKLPLSYFKSATSTNNPDSMIGTTSVGNHDGAWWIGGDPQYPTGDYGTNWMGTIAEITITNKVISFTEAFP